MDTRSVRIDEPLYQRIEERRREDETFSEAVARLINDWSLVALADTLDTEEADRHRDAIDASKETGLSDIEELLDQQEIDP